jgi:hypothetical protein
MIILQYPVKIPYSMIKTCEYLNEPIKNLTDNVSNLSANYSSNNQNQDSTQLLQNVQDKVKVLLDEQYIIHEKILN